MNHVNVTFSWRRWLLGVWWARSAYSLYLGPVSIAILRVRG